MGMYYSASYDDAVIPPENYDEAIKLLGPELIAEPDGWDTMSKADKVAHLLVETLGSMGGDPVVIEEGDGAGVDIGEMGYWESASYGFGETLTSILGLCRPGAMLRHSGSEEGQEDVGGYVERVEPDGRVHEHSPNITWPTLQEQPEAKGFRTFHDERAAGIWLGEDACFRVEYDQEKDVITFYVGDKAGEVSVWNSDNAG